MRVLLVITVLLAVAGCGADHRKAPAATATSHATLSTMSVSERTYVNFLTNAGIIPTYGSTSTALVLGHQICDRYARGDSFPAVVATLTDNGIPAHEAGEINGAATAAFCPQYKF